MAFNTGTKQEPFIAAECDGCGERIERSEDETPCPHCSGYFHNHNCYTDHIEKEHRQ